MKRVMWIVSVIPFIITAIALQFMPDSVPMHYNISGGDRPLGIQI